jgi:pimeloyl-ACP methyl ester carboxylesterase
MVAAILLAGSTPGLADDSPALRFARPYERGRIPVVFVHGMLGAPDNWSVMIDRLSAEPVVCQRFQLLTFRYDSLRSISESGLLLKQALADARRRVDPQGIDTAFDQVVLVGHSMGGLVAKAAAHMDSTPRVGRIIFIATPHRGSPVDRGAVRSAGNWLARRTLPAASRSTSVDELAADSAFLAELERARITDGIPCHSIIATLRDPSIERASDGLVPVTSARLADAESEVVVSTAHYCLAHPQVIGEVRRILTEHAAAPSRRRAAQFPS